MSTVLKPVKDSVEGKPSETLAATTIEGSNAGDKKTKVAADASAQNELASLVTSMNEDDMKASLKRLSRSEQSKTLSALTAAVNGD